MLSGRARKGRCRHRSQTGSGPRRSRRRPHFLECLEALGDAFSWHIPQLNGPVVRQPEARQQARSRSRGPHPQQARCTLRSRPHSSDDQGIRARSRTDSGRQVRPRIVRPPANKASTDSSSKRCRCRSRRQLLDDLESRRASVEHAANLSPMSAALTRGVAGAAAGTPSSAAYTPVPMQLAFRRLIAVLDADSPSAGVFAYCAVFVSPRARSPSLQASSASRCGDGH